MKPNITTIVKSTSHGAAGQLFIIQTLSETLFKPALLQHVSLYLYNGQLDYHHEIKELSEASNKLSLREYMFTYFATESIRKYITPIAERFPVKIDDELTEGSPNAIFSQISETSLPVYEEMFETLLDGDLSAKARFACAVIKGQIEFPDSN